MPLTFGLDATKAIVMLAGIYYGSQYGGSTTSILLRIPGEAASVMTCIDGNAMAKKGRAGAALCIAAVGSFIAGTFGVIVLTVIAPPLAAFALRFGPPEYTALLVLGLVFLAYMSTTSLVRTLLMASFGLLLGTVGIDVMTGHFRYSFNVPELGDGLGIVPVAVGLFGLGEILSTPSRQVTGDVVRPRLRELWPSREEWRQSVMPIARGSVLGFLIGIIPGSAHIISSFLSYAVERRVSKHPEEFGKGAVAGVAGPESANNAASTGAFVPMLALGIPTGPVTAVLMAALLIHGVPPGPTLVNDHPNVFWGFVASMYVGNLMLLALNLPLVGVFVNLLRIPYAYLYPLIIMFCVIGVYEVNHSIVDVWIMLIMGVVGYALKKFGFDPGAAGARPRHRADLRDEPPAVAHHVERGLGHLRAAADRADAAPHLRPACWCCRRARSSRRRIGAPAWRRWKAASAGERRPGGTPGPIRRVSTRQHSCAREYLPAWTSRKRRMGSG